MEKIVEKQMLTRVPMVAATGRVSSFKKIIATRFCHGLAVVAATGRGRLSDVYFCCFVS